MAFAGGLSEPLMPATENNKIPLLPFAFGDFEIRISIAMQI